MISRYRAVFNTDDGKIVLNDMMKTFSVLDSTFDADPYIHAYNEGARSTVMRILKTINTNPDAVKTAVKGQLEDYYEIQIWI